MHLEFTQSRITYKNKFQGLQIHFYTDQQPSACVTRSLIVWYLAIEVKGEHQKQKAKAKVFFFGVKQKMKSSPDFGTLSSFELALELFGQLSSETNNEITRLFYFFLRLSI